MLEIKGLKAGYGAMSVLQGIDMQIHAGEIVALLGSNGVGKTTLNNVISGFIVPTAGSVTFKGQRITGLKPLEIVALGIAHVPEGRKIFPNLSVRDNLKLGAFRRAHERIKQNFDRICALFPRLKDHTGFDGLVALLRKECPMLPQIEVFVDNEPATTPGVIGPKYIKWLMKQCSSRKHRYELNLVSTKGRHR